MCIRDRPTSASPVYDGVLKVKENVDFSAIAIRPTGNSRVVSEKINFSKSSMKPIVANQPVNKQYEFKGVTTLVEMCIRDRYKSRLHR